MKRIFVTLEWFSGITLAWLSVYGFSYVVDVPVEWEQVAAAGYGGSLLVILYNSSGGLKK